MSSSSTTASDGTTSTLTLTSHLDDLNKLRLNSDEDDKEDETTISCVVDSKLPPQSPEELARFKRQ